MPHPPRTLLLLLGAALLGACSPNPTAAFREVQDKVASRTGGKRLHWRKGGPADAEVQKEIQRLLRCQLTADSAVQIALLNSRSIQAAYEDLGIAEAEYLQALLPSNPRFSGFARYPDRPPFSSNLEGELSANLLDLLLFPARMKNAKAVREAARLRVASEVLGLVTDTKSALYTLQARQQLLGRLKLIRSTNEASLDIASRQHQAGNASDLDLANQQALYSQSKVDIARTQMEIRSDRERLNRLMGLWGPALNWKVADQLPTIPKSEGSLANLEKRAIAERIDVGLARQNVISIGRALSLRSGTRFLPADIQVGVSREKEVDGSVVTGPTVDLQLPLFDFGQAAVPKLQAQYRQAQHRMEALAVNARSEVREARDLVVASRDMANFYGKTLLPERLKILNQTQLFYNAMQIGPIDLLSAKEQQLETERRYIEAWRDYWIARVKLERALTGGGGGEGGNLMARSSVATRGGEERAPTGGNSGVTSAQDE